MSKKAVILFNLGGPDEPGAIQPFLFNLFNDPAIIDLPGLIRWPLAKFISARRAPVAKEIYAHMGGRSPLLDMTNDQARALEKKLSAASPDSKVFACMRYWHPMSADVVQVVKSFDPDEIVLLPLYPQFSTTTTGSSITDWKKAAARIGLNKPTFAVCCYPTGQGWVTSAAKGLNEEMARGQNDNIRVLFSAHGLPQNIIDKGDPYQWQVEQSAGAIAERAGLAKDRWTICYQSRVGRLQWIGPSLDDEIKRAAQDNVAVCIFPIAFVSEHSETLVELDIEYRDMAADLGIPAYYRAATVGVAEDFISGLAALVENAAAGKKNIGPGDELTCPQDNMCCPNAAEQDRKQL